MMMTHQLHQRQISVSGILTAAPSVNIASMASNVPDHPISDDDEEIDPSQGQDTVEVMETDKPQNNSDDDFGFASQFAMDVDNGPPIAQNVVKPMMHAMTYKLDETKLKSAMDRHKCPSNCYGLQTPMLNKSMWADVPTRSRSVDCSLQKIQRPLVKGLIALSKFAGQTTMNQDGIDGFTLLANAIFTVNCVRREMLKPVIDPQFRGLCEVPVYDKTKDKDKKKSREY